jgi:hypothetical protein
VLDRDVQEQSSPERMLLRTRVFDARAPLLVDLLVFKARTTTGTTAIRAFALKAKQISSSTLGQLPRTLDGHNMAFTKPRCLEPLMTKIA